jgi:putative membrane protein
MVKLLLQWILSAAGLLVIAQIVPGFSVQGIGPALVAVAVIGLLNATLGTLLKVVTFPLSILTLGLFLLVINGVVLLLTSSLVRGFHVRGIGAAFWGAVAMAVLGMVIRLVTKHT